MQQRLPAEGQRGRKTAIAVSCWWCCSKPKKRQGIAFACFSMYSGKRSAAQRNALYCCLCSSVSLAATSPCINQEIYNTLCCSRFLTNRTGQTTRQLAKQLQQQQQPHPPLAQQLPLPTAVAAAGGALLSNLRSTTGVSTVP